MVRLHILAPRNIYRSTHTHTPLQVNDGLARVSDMVRLHILAQRGGIWLDATVLCATSFTWVHSIQVRGVCKREGGDYAWGVQKRGGRDYGDTSTAAESGWMRWPFHQMVRKVHVVSEWPCDPMYETHACDPMHGTHACDPMHRTHACNPMQETHACDPMHETHACDLMHATPCMRLMHATPCMRLMHVRDSPYGVDRAGHSDGLLSIEADRLPTCM